MESELENEERWETLGRLAPILIHDLGSPLQVLSFCVDRLNSQSTFDSQRNLEQLNLGMLKVQSFFETFRGLARPSVTSSSLGDVRILIEKLWAQDRDRTHSSLEFRIRDRAKSFDWKLHPLDLIHLLGSTLNEVFLGEDKTPRSTHMTLAFSLPEEKESAFVIHTGGLQGIPREILRLVTNEWNSLGRRLEWNESASRCSNFDFEVVCMQVDDICAL